MRRSWPSPGRRRSVLVAVFGIAVAGVASAAVADVAEVAATVAAPPSPGTASAFAALLDGAYERLLDANPSLATAQGDRRGDERWEDLSDAGLAAEAALARRELDAALAFPEAALGTRERLQRRIFIRQQELLLERHRWRNHLYPLNQIVGPHVDVPRVLASQPVTDLAAARRWLRRLSAAGPHLERLVQRLEAQSAAGVYLPRSVYPILLAQARELVAGAPQRPADTSPMARQGPVGTRASQGPTGTRASQGSTGPMAPQGPMGTRASQGSTGSMAPQEPTDASPILADFTRKVAALQLPAAQREALLADAQRALRQDLEPAYHRLIATLEAHSARAPADGAVWQLPEGEAFYAFLLRQFTTTDLDADAIHRLGLAEAQRLHAAMRELMARIGAQGSLQEFMQRMKAERRFYLADDAAGRAAYLARARGIVAAMQARLGAAFRQPPALPLEIRATEPYRAAGAPGGFYEPGTPDGSRPGIVHLNLLHLETRPLYDLEALLYHEALPGHHLQISSILVDPTIPRLRKINRWWQDTAFVEGWALYAERLAHELGFYEDPYADFGRLAGELWRAARLVVDSGLHARRWSREQAIRWLDENTPSPHEANVQAVDRYLAVPGQATAFTVGMLQIVAERERARRELGPRFDLREFHAVVLENGYVPLWALREHVDDWITSRR